MIQILRRGFKNHAISCNIKYEVQTKKVNI